MADQQADRDSFLHWLREILGLRKLHPVLGTGEFLDLGGENLHVFSFLRRTTDEAILCVNNLAGSPQTVELDLAELGLGEPVVLHGSPVEVTATRGGVRITLDGHRFCWLDVRPPTHA